MFINLSFIGESLYDSSFKPCYMGLSIVFTRGYMSRHPILHLSKNSNQNKALLLPFHPYLKEKIKIGKMQSR